VFGEEKALDICPGFSTSEEPGGHDFRIIEDETIAGLYAVDYVREFFVLESVGGAVHDEQPGFGAGWGGLLSDKIGG
jgi:hypothetical protein